jgi:hypothetical protein
MEIGSLDEKKDGKEERETDEKCKTKQRKKRRKTANYWE